ncbi:lysyl oxidase family protein [Streptomyces liangshanensis]|uniref:Protein-lysine 6-oxidase n=1 Tax=Streptomyces liangshanensis TaxID=2717324 RepID=A0A6G9GWT4_9ACTN|nr:lysyl oxidase family protein [Streptomyces liangshanensis]QIQ02732.1 protein-lysine 6-oxidase [Streptomyces liangshanensis]
MTRDHRNRFGRPALAASAALAVVAGVAGAAPVAGATAPAGPRISLIAASTTVTLDRWEGEPGVYLDLGAYVTVDGAPLEFKVTRASYKTPVVADQIIRDGGKTRTKRLPAGLVKDFSGLQGFVEVTVKNAAGKQVLKTSDTFCPNNASGRIRPDAPATSKYPESCPTNPFTLGSVWGVEKGWASNTSNGYYSEPVDLPAGGYTATVAVAKKYRDLLGIANKPQTIKVTVRTISEDGEGAAARSAKRAGTAAHSAHSAHDMSNMGAGHDMAGMGTAPGSAPTPGTGHVYSNGRGADAPTPPARPHAIGPRALKHLGDGPGHTDGSRIAPALKPNTKRPTGAAKVPDVPKPDLRSLPAWDIGISDGEDGDVPGKDYMVFSANVWNAGPAPLVVDGFRSPGKELMDAYQYFYDAKGKQVGYTPTGTMEWDPRVGHEHWHFTDFASYRLLSADKSEIVRSGKEAFCLANTDAIDYTVKNANWHPNNTDLSTACGQQNSISVREVLDVGSGDTYTQYRPGQSFDVTDLKNGTYYIEVIANPEHRLRETNLKNNVALRKVILTGTTGARKVTVPPIDLITAP